MWGALVSPHGMDCACWLVLYHLHLVTSTTKYVLVRGDELFVGLSQLPRFLTILIRFLHFYTRFFNTSSSRVFFYCTQSAAWDLSLQRWLSHTAARYPLLCRQDMRALLYYNIWSVVLLIDWFCCKITALLSCSAVLFTSPRFSLPLHCGIFIAASLWHRFVFS